MVDASVDVFSVFVEFLNIAMTEQRVYFSIGVAHYALTKANSYLCWFFSSDLKFLYMSAPSDPDILVNLYMNLFDP